MYSLMRKVKTRLLARGGKSNQLQKEMDIESSKEINTAEIKTVCLALGPYRNLTTLTAGMLFLHPNCQVLNHAGVRIFGDNKLDFLIDYSDEKFESFLQYGIYNSQTGGPGGYGGSITYSHAFESGNKLRDIFESGGGDSVKKNVECFFWKESLMTSFHIRDNSVDLDKLFAANKRIRFLIPVRNPMNCAISNHRMSYIDPDRKKRKNGTLFKGVGKNPSVDRVLGAVLDEFLWIADLKKRYPRRFFIFFEHEFGKEIITELADFLKLKPYASWVENCLDAFDIKPGYKLTQELRTEYRNYIETNFANHQKFADKLLHFYYSYE